MVVLILAVAILSGAYAYLRATTLTTPDQLAAKGFDRAWWDTAVFYAGVAVVVGILDVMVFRWIGGAASADALRTFLLMAVGIGIAPDFLAAVVFKMRRLADFTALHLMQIVGFGWLLPIAYAA